jgi:hypothetical protein
MTQWVQPSQVLLLVHLTSDAGEQITGAAIPSTAGR